MLLILTLWSVLNKLCNLSTYTGTCPIGFIQLNLLAFKPIKGQQIRKRAPHNQCVSLLIYERYSV